MRGREKDKHKKNKISKREKRRHRSKGHKKDSKTTKSQSSTSSGKKKAKTDTEGTPYHNHHPHHPREAQSNHSQWQSVTLRKEQAGRQNKQCIYKMSIVAFRHRRRIILFVHSLLLHNHHNIQHTCHIIMHKN